MLKNIFILVSIITLFSCKTDTSKYAKISGLIANNVAKEVSIISNGFKKVIPINLDGTFSDTLKIAKNGYHTFYDGKNKQMFFLNNGDDITINYNYDDAKNSIIFNGIGSETSNYLVTKIKFETKEKIKDYRSLFKLEEEVFNTRISYLESEVSKMLSGNIDSMVKVKELANYNKIFTKIKQNYKVQQKQNSVLAKGKPSPKFVNYINYKGGKTSLDDFKGTYVYLDIWATWCGPCKQQIPFLDKIEKEYRHKNIKFVSISTDDARRNGGSWDKAKDKWKKMIKDKKMGGTQLFANKGFQSDFIKAYGINSIPRFILIDPDGNIVDVNAPRPSQPQLKELLNSLL
ncbi:MAG: TlpA family protein disulfide reductase [Flavobacteriaceae bacterium]|nr:TlpA family protein disulfide reductase [Flavobacteriaceae bacterium]